MIKYGTGMPSFLEANAVLVLVQVVLGLVPLENRFKDEVNHISCHINLWQVLSCDYFAMRACSLITKR